MRLLIGLLMVGMLGCEGERGTEAWDCEDVRGSIEELGCAEEWYHRCEFMRDVDGGKCFDEWTRWVDCEETRGDCEQCWEEHLALMYCV